MTLTFTPYSTAIFTLSLPIFAMTIVPLVAENEAVPFVAVAEPRATPSIAKKSTRSFVSRPERVMKPPADWITTPRVFAVLMFVGVSFSAFIVPNPLHGAFVLYEDNAEPGT